MQIAEEQTKYINEIEKNLIYVKNYNIAIVEFLRGITESQGDENLNKAIKLKNGYYTIREQIDNKKLQTYGKTKKEVTSKMKELLLISNKTNFLNYYNHWMNEYKIPLLKKNSINSIKQTYNKYILNDLSNKFIEDITNNDLKAILNNIPANKERTKTIVYNNLNNLFKFAIKENIIKNNPLQNIYIKKNNGNKKRAMTINEQNALERFLSNNYTIYNNYYIFLLNTGCRRQEAINITKKDINYNNMTLHIKGTKTKSSDRVIPINQKILNLLGNNLGNNDVPFPFNANTVQHNFKKIIKKIGLDDKEITLHSLRHTYATRVLESGISPKILQKWLGHSSIKITMDIYSDIQSEFEKNEFLKLKISQND